MDLATRIICTIGPASESKEVIEQLMLEGMDIARFNFAHCRLSQFEMCKAHIAELNTIHNKSVKILQDLQGPRMRVGVLPEEGLELHDDQEITFTTDPSKTEAILINDPYLHEDIEVDHPIFLSNGDMELIVTEKHGPLIKAKVLRGGVLFTRKGVNVPQTNSKTSSLTDKDFGDVEYGVKAGVDYIALSFVKDGDDISKLREFVTKAGKGIGVPTDHIKLVAKIERRQALENLDSILATVDLVMVARGDLGIEVPIEDLPILQKDIINRANHKGKPSIVATQMLMSMVNHSFPTRAEISDVANAVLDGASSLMLSDETAFGEYPVESVKMLVKVAKRIEQFQYGQKNQFA